MADKWAIDLGTTNTVVAEWRVDAPQTINLPDASVLQQPYRVPLIPSVLYVVDPEKEEVLIGRKAQEEDWSGKSPNCFRSFKRQLARKLGVVTRLGGQEYTPERVARLYLRELFAQLQARYGKVVEEITCTVPVDFYEPYREALNRLVTPLGVTQMRTVDEPVAAAIGYGLSLQSEQVVMVVDFGGGTLDMALIRTGRGQAWEEGRATVLAKAGESLGGDDIDSWIMEAVAARYKKRLEHFAHLHRLLKGAAEKVKIDLTTHESAQFTVYDDRTSKSLDQVFTRSEFEQILEQNGLFRHLKAALDKVLTLAERKGMGKDDIEHVLLIGGSCLIPSVRALIQEYFGAARVKEHLPFEAVAHGACVFAQGMARPVDFIQHDYGLRILNTQTYRHEYEILVPKGTVYPTKTDFTVLTLAASRPNQDEIELLIYEIGGDESFSGEYVWVGGQLRKIGSPGGNSVCLNEGAPTLARLNPPGMPNRDRLQVSFSIDLERHLCVSVQDLVRGVDLLLDQPVVQLR